MNSNNISVSSKMKVISILIFSLFPFFSFMQMTSLNAMHGFLDIHQYDNFKIGMLSSSYVLGDAIFLIPAGLVLDKWRSTHVAIIGLCVYLMALYFFSISHTLHKLILYRFIMGCAHAFALLSCFKLISQHIKTSHQSLMVSLTLTIALLGGLVSQTPLFLLIEHVGLANALKINVIVGIIIAILMLCFKKTITVKNVLKQRYIHAFKDNIKYSFFNYFNWYAAIFVCVLSLPLMIFGSVWGIDFLTHIDSLDAAQAANASAMLFMGVILGCPLVGWLSEKVSLDTLSRAGLLLTILMLCIIIYFHHNQALFYKLFFLMLGMASASQVIGYSVMTQNTLPDYAGISIGFGNSLIMLFTSLAQMLFGWLLHKNIIVSECFLGSYAIPVAFIMSLFAFSLVLSMLKKTTNQ